MRVLITGGAGFIGTATCHALKEAGHEPVVFDRAEGDNIRDGKAVWLAISGVDAVIHLAGMLGTAELFSKAYEAVDINIVGTLHVLDACAASATPYVGITMPRSGWANVYTATKHCADQLAEAWRRHRGVPVTHVRAFNAYGPGQKHGPGHPKKIVPVFAAEAWARRPIPIWGDGEQTVDLVHVDDLAAVLVDALAYGDGRTLEAGSGTALTVNHVADLVLRVTGSPAGVQHLPMRDGEDPHTNIVAARPACPPFDVGKFCTAVVSYQQ